MGYVIVFMSCCAGYLLELACLHLKKLAHIPCTALTWTPQRGSLKETVGINTNQLPIEEEQYFFLIKFKGCKKFNGAFLHCQRMKVISRLNYPLPSYVFFWPFYKLYQIFLTRNKHKEQNTKTIHIHLHHVLEVFFIMRIHQMWCSHKGQCFHHWLILLHELGQAKVCYVCLEGVGIKKYVSSLSQ